MTAIVKLTINNYPILIGDILLSGFEDENIEPLKVPTVNDLSNIFPKGSGFVPSNLRQKLAIIGDNIAIGWAGNYISSKVVIKEIIEKNQKKPFTRDSLKNYFESLDETIWNQGVSFAGFITDGNKVQDFSVNAKNIRSSNSSIYKTISLLGSGTEAIQNVLGKLNIIQPNSATFGNNFTQALLQALGLTGHLLGTEINLHSSLLEFFGAGYEIVTHTGKRFEKINDICYLFWQVSVNNQQVRISQLNRAIKLTYLNDILLLRIETITSNNNTPVDFSFETYFQFVSPIYRNIKKHEIDLANFKPPSLNSQFICNFFIFLDKNQQVTCLTKVSTMLKEPDIKFIEENGVPYQFAIKESFLKEVSNVIRNAYNQ